MQFRDDSEVSLEDFMGGDDRVCLSAWVSFGNDDAERLENRKGVEGLINFLYKNKHMTPFESTVFTFRIKRPSLWRVSSSVKGVHPIMNGRDVILKCFLSSTYRPLTAPCSKRASPETTTSSPVPQNNML